MQVILEVVGDPGSPVAVVHAEEGQVRVRVQIGEGRAPAEGKKRGDVFSSSSSTKLSGFFVGVLDIESDIKT